jgi:cold shock CspA family protein
VIERKEGEDFFAHASAIKEQDHFEFLSHLILLQGR